MIKATEGSPAILYIIDTLHRRWGSIFINKINKRIMWGESPTYKYKHLDQIQMSDPKITESIFW